ncbi:hypothetical protein AACH06_18380 [Ideonella sp. DXS29W]|uniref:Uncharacterized protein n=1 Tax=Ideonella lacteola TaxID=2984193 RepID=A0ABU9BV97_9BURK
MRLPIGADQPPRLHAGLGAFLRDGRLGDVQVGMAKSEVLNAAGLPAEFGRGESLGDAAVWINGRTTFWFSGSTLERIGIYFVLEYLSNPAIEYDPDFPDRSVPKGMLEDYMRRFGIDFVVEAESITTSGGVSIGFSGDGMVCSMVVPPVPMPRGRRRR